MNKLIKFMRDKHRMCGQRRVLPQVTVRLPLWSSVDFSDWELYSLAQDLTCQPWYERDHFLFELLKQRASFATGSVVYDKQDNLLKIHNGTKLVPLENSSYGV